jgi:hypothetical protein
MPKVSRNNSIATVSNVHCPMSRCRRAFRYSNVCLGKIARTVCPSHKKGLCSMCIRFARSPTTIISRFFELRATKLQKKYQQPIFFSLEHQTTDLPYFHLVHLRAHSAIEVARSRSRSTPGPSTLVSLFVCLFDTSSYLFFSAPVSSLCSLSSSSA